MIKRPPNIDYDNNWKEIIEKYTFEAIAFFLPTLSSQIDTSKKPIFLEQEMRNIKRKTLKGRKRIIDKLIKVWLKTGEERWILIHIEIESSDSEGFNKRMYIYFSRAFDKYDVAIVGLALFVGENTPPNYDKFVEENFGTILSYAYNTYVVATQDEAALLASDNIFALFILANLYTIKTKDDMKRRLELKKKMHELAIERQIPFEVMEDLLTFVFEIMALPMEEAKTYQKFKELKSKAMTDTAFKKRRLKTHKVFIDIYSKDIYGFYPSEMVKAIKEKDNVLKEKDNVLKEKDNVLKEKDNVLKEKDNVLKEKEETLRRTVIYLYSKDGKTIEAIAEITNMPIEVINKIIIANNK